MHQLTDSVIYSLHCVILNIAKDFVTGVHIPQEEQKGSNFSFVAPSSEEL